MDTQILIAIIGAPAALVAAATPLILGLRADRKKEQTDTRVAATDDTVTTLKKIIVDQAIENAELTRDLEKCRASSPKGQT